VAAAIEGKSWWPPLLRGKVGGRRYLGAKLVAAAIEGQSWWPPLLRGKVGGLRY